MKFFFDSSECNKINRCQRVHCTTHDDQRCSLCKPGYHPDGQTCERKRFENLNIYEQYNQFKLIFTFVQILEKCLLLNNYCHIYFSNM